MLLHLKNHFMDLLISIREKESSFVLELLQKFDFVKVKQLESSYTLESLELSLKQMKLMKEGKLRKPAISELFEAEI